MAHIIRPDKIRRYHDPYIAPIYGTRGPCALCRTYSDLTENHVPPESVGNTDRWIARSYLATSTANKDLVLGRQFRSGLKFRTLCMSCNTGLGGTEDKAISDFFARVRKIIESPLILTNLVRIPAKPNLIYRGLLAHLISANDNGIPSSFDTEAREIFFRKRDIRLNSWSLFYWLYTGPDIFLMRDAFFTTWHPRLDVVQIQIVKIYPLAFMFVQKPWFVGLPNVVSFMRQRDEEEIDLPLLTRRRDENTVWPIIPQDNNIILLGGSSSSYIGHRD